MNSVSLTELSGGTFVFQGRVDLSNAGYALDAGKKDFKRHLDIMIDIEHADCASTVGMALLLEWSTWSGANGKRLSYHNASKRLVELVKLNDVEDLLLII